MKQITAFILTAAVAAAPIAWMAPQASAADAAPSAASASAASARQDPAAQAQVLIDKGLAYLKAQQKPDGGWQTDKDFPAMTAIVLRAFVESGGKYDANTDFVKKGYDRLFKYQLDTGGIYQDALANYNTAIAVSSIAAAKNPAYKERLDRAVAFLKKLQWVPNGEKGPKGETVNDPKNPWYGGWGYGNHSRPDLSNAHFSIEALKDAGLKEDDPAFQAAIKFVTRNQNNSETNDQKFAGDDGGFIYGVGTNGEGDSEAGEFTSPDGRRVWRSYGSMTYAGLKSMIYAGLKRDDPRVKAAMEWIRKNWTLDENPGMRLNKPDQAKNGLFYYYNVFARALDAYDEPVITDAKGTKHDWRAELIQKLAAQQQPDGHWEGEKRWMESDPVLSTAYAVQALEAAAKDLKEHPAQ
jgi:squalene-hopene/tetraprenyl-beta-curcumene cyclase